ncbi:hypothetical protein RI103_12900 [Paraburkholderia sp. FT54]|nr:hypothetical protein [Paraburkholderia sp. FT54]WNC91778.1 hypothetical protein RI103_12900 [Paraburkholderia sp. FT54]
MTRSFIPPTAAAEPFAHGIALACVVTEIGLASLKVRRVPAAARER